MESAHLAHPFKAGDPGPMNGPVQKIEFGHSGDGSHILQRVTLGPMQMTIAIPAASVPHVQAALAEGARLLKNKIVVPGADAWFPSDAASAPLASEDPDEQKPNES